MPFNDKRILPNLANIKVGELKNFSATTISYNEYVQIMENKVHRLVAQFINNEEEEIESTLQMAYNLLNFTTKSYPVTAEGVAEEIMASEEYKNWITEVMYRFKRTHAEKVSIESKIFHFQEATQTEDQSLPDFLEGLSSATL